MVSIVIQLVIAPFSASCFFFFPMIDVLAIDSGSCVKMHSESWPAAAHLEASMAWQYSCSGKLFGVMMEMDTFE